MNSLHQGQVISKKNGKEIIDCKECGFMHVFPLPTLEETENIYKNEYYQKEKPNYITENVKDKEWWINTYNRRFEVYEKYLKKEKRTLLDIGSGPGVFLEAAKNRGWEVTGIEPNLFAADHTKKLGFNIINEMYDKKLSEQLNKYDLINLTLVLEHIVNPVELIKLAYNQLNENGLISIVVPNDYSPFQKILHNNYNYNDWWVVPDHHLNYFNRDSLNHIISKNKFKIVHEETTFPIDIFLLMGDDYINNPELGRTVHQKRVDFETKLINSGESNLLTKLYSELAKINIGRELFVIGQKL
jgi:2-polyprenyl-3-methyl-5-hydroxy-6-metoxy-1,4-benzoquinol methylase